MSVTFLKTHKNLSALEKTFLSKDESASYPARWCVQQISLELTIWKPDKLS